MVDYTILINSESQSIRLSNRESNRRSNRLSIPLYNPEPSMISYYNYSYDMQRSMEREDLAKAFYKWKLFMRDRKNTLSYLARKNYQNFHVLPHLPSIREVEKSSAGLLTWARSGPYR